MRTVFKVTVGLILGCLVLVIGCAVLVGAGADEASKSLDAEQAKNAITNQQARQIKLGTRRRVVIAKLGRPKDTQESENEGLGKSGCIYYNIRGGSFGDTWQFCFDNGRLTGKNRL